MGGFVLDTLAAASPAQETVTLCLDGATQAKVDALEARFDAALDHDKLHGSAEDPHPQFEALVREREQLRDAIAASEVIFTFESMGWTARVALQAAHPPRPGVLADGLRGYNYETYLPALIAASVAQVTGHDGDTTPGDQIPQATWDDLLGAPEITADQATTDRPARPAIKAKLNAGQVNRLINAAQAVNESEVDVPPSGLSLLETQDSKESSTSPSPGASPRAGSPGGSRRTSTTSSGGRAPTSRKPSKKASKSTKRSSGRSDGS